MYSTYCRTFRLWYRTLTGSLWDSNKRFIVPTYFWPLLNKEVKFDMSEYTF